MGMCFSTSRVIQLPECVRLRRMCCLRESISMWQSSDLTRPISTQAICATTS